MASPIQGTIVAIDVAVGDEVRQGQQVAVVEAMKMEHVITAPLKRLPPAPARTTKKYPYIDPW